jgi:tetratricopeptide (TPR) repeat protein
MLSEETLLVFAGLIACGMVLLGALEIVWPAAPRGRGRRYDPRRSVRRRMRRRPPGRGSVHPAGRGYTLTRRTPTRAPASAAPAVRAPAAAITAAAALPGAPVPPPEPAAATLSEAAPAADPCLEEVFALYQERRYADVVALGERALAADPGAARRSGRPHDVAALWSVVGLAKKGLEDSDGAAFALEAAIEVAPAQERPPYEHHFLALVREEARRFLGDADDAGGHSEERLTALRAAVTWLRRGRAVADGDAEVEEMLATTLVALWPAYEQTVVVLTRHHEFHRARRLLREALADSAFPAASAQTFRALLCSTFSGEIGKLTALAIRSMDRKREGEALAALQRAEGLLGVIPQASLAPRRRQEVDRRLWWGYTKLGMVHLEHGRVDAALEPLFRALGFGDVSADQRAETRAAVVRALETVAERYVGDGQDGELEFGELLRRARELGVPEDDLAGAVARGRGPVEAVPARDA